RAAESRPRAARMRMLPDDDHVGLRLERRVGEHILGATIRDAQSHRTPALFPAQRLEPCIGTRLRALQYLVAGRALTAHEAGRLRHIGRVHGKRFRVRSKMFADPAYRRDGRCSEIDANYHAVELSPTDCLCSAATSGTHLFPPPTEELLRPCSGLRPLPVGRLMMMRGGGRHGVPFATLQ